MKLCEATKFTLAPQKRYQNNILLYRDDIGKVKHSLHTVPDLVFGKKSGWDKEGCKEVVFTWKEFDGKNSKIHPKSQSRSSSSSRGRKKFDLSFLPSQRDEAHSYGVSTKYGDTASDLVQNRFEEDWVREKEVEFLERKQKEKQRKEKMEALKNRNTTKNTGDKKAGNPMNPFYEPSSLSENTVDLFKMQKFKSVPHRVDTRR